MSIFFFFKHTQTCTIVRIVSECIVKHNACDNYITKTHTSIAGSEKPQLPKMVRSSQKLSCGRTTGCHLQLPKVQVYFITSWIAARSNNRSKQDKSIEKPKQGKIRPIHQMYSGMTLAELLRMQKTKFLRFGEVLVPCHCHIWLAQIKDNQY